MVSTRVGANRILLVNQSIGGGLGTRLNTVTAADWTNSAYNNLSDAIFAAQCGDEGRSLPMTMRHGGHTALVAQGAAVKARHLRIEAGLVDEDQSCALPLRLEHAPLLARGLHVRARLLGGVRGFFYNSDPGDRVDATVQ